MFAALPVVVFVVALIARPFELIAEWKGIPILPVVVATCLGGLGLDIGLGRIKPRASTLSTIVAMSFAWGLVTLALSPTGRLIDALALDAVPLAVFVLVSTMASRPRSLERIATALVLASLWVGVVGIHLAMAPEVCVAFGEDDGPNAIGQPDGRSCDSVAVCYHEAPNPDATYRCERSGWFGTTTVDEGRLRYVGVLSDPNEVALALALALPIAFARSRTAPSRLGRILAVGFAAITVAVVLLSRSRSGVLVLAALPVARAWLEGKRRRVATALLVAAPLLLVGGRSGERASASTAERIEILQEGLAMLRANPIAGVGRGQFTEHHPLTAHNSFLLAGAEEGPVGAVLWTALLLAAWGAATPRKAPPRVEPPNEWLLATRTSILGLAAGCFFLSLNRHVVTWLYVALAEGTAGLGRSSSGSTIAGSSIPLLVRATLLASAILLGVAVVAYGHW